MSLQNQLIRLRPELGFVSLRCDRYVAEDRVQQKFWRLGPVEYELCAFLESPISFDEAAKTASHSSQSLVEAGPEKVKKSLLWLLQAGIVEILPAEGAPHATPNLAVKSPIRLFDPCFFRINLLNGEKIERFTRPLTWLISYPLLAIAVIVWIVGAVFAVNNLSQLTSMSTKLFVPGSQWWFLIAWVILKFVHEMGHAIACTKVGIKPVAAGIGFIFFTPSPFVNTTNAWSLPNHWSRILVSAAGMLFELTLASIAVIGACLSEAPSIQCLCASIITLGTIATLAFNGNPLMRYDGYYIMIDLLGRPNLWQDANASMKKLVWSFFSNSDKKVEIAPLLQLYGLTSFFYRMLTITALGWGLWVAWDGIGLIVVGIFGVIWFVLPKILRQKSPTNPEISIEPRVKWLDISGKKVARVAAALCAIILLGFLPSPFQVYWPGCVDFVEPVEIRADAPGLVTRIYYHDGQGVRKGDEIMVLSNPDLELEAVNAEIEFRTIEQKCNVLRAQRKEAELRAEESNLEAARFLYESFQEKVKRLSIRAPRDGVLMIRASQNLIGVFLQEGHQIGLIVDPSRLEVRASAPADRWDLLSRSSGAETDIHLSNGECWKGELTQVLPRTTDKLEFPTLGGLYGGPLTVRIGKSENGKEEYKTIAPRCQLRVALKPNTFQRSVWFPDYRPNLPSPGLLCSVKLERERESVWQTLYRWCSAALQVRFRQETT